MKTAFVFPGQGSQAVGMLNSYADHPAVVATLDEANSALGFDLSAMIANGPADELNQTINTQPAVLAADVAIFRVWAAGGGTMPAVVAGHSLGEYAALVAADALSFADALPLVRFRAQMMQEAVPAEAGGMAAILGLDDDGVIAACAEAAQGEVVEAVNFNTPGQVVIAGNKAAVERAMQIAQEKGAKRAMALPVSVPSHCALMKPAAERLNEFLKGVAISAPKIPVIHNATVDSYDDPGQIREVLVRQLYSPVRWVETVTRLAQMDIGRMVECGPGKVLTGLDKRIATNATHLALNDRAALDAALVG